MAPSARPNPLTSSGMQLHTADGARKYLTAGERDAFLRAAERADRDTRTLCMTLAYAGCRLSEALALTADRVDLAAGTLAFESLKKRKRGIYRAVPVPPTLLDALDLVHGIRERLARRGRGRGERLWPWSRMTGWRAVHAVMAAAGLGDPHLAERAASWLRGGGGGCGNPAQPRAEMARPRPTHHHRHLRQRRRRRGTRHRSEHGGLIPKNWRAADAQRPAWSPRLCRPARPTPRPIHNHRWREQSDFTCNFCLHTIS